MRIGIVNDLKLAVETLKRAVEGAPGLDVAWVAEDGQQAVEQCRRDRPDVVLMDLLMPVMDGVEATCRIMRESPCSILVVTSTVEGHAAKVFQAMGCGALDAVPTPTLGPGGRLSGAEPLLEKIARLGRLAAGREKAERIDLARPPPPPRENAADLPPLVVLGASTGGPPALSEVLEELGREPPVAVVIIQHLDVRFAAGLAEWLSGHPHTLPVIPATPGMRPTAGRALLAASNDHLILRDTLELDYTADPVDNPYRPSVDVFFRSVRQHWPRPGAAAVLTGMGRDGAKGLLDLRQAGWLTLAQDEESSVLYGMPKAAAQLGAAQHILPPEAIGRHVMNWAPRAPHPKGPL